MTTAIGNIPEDNQSSLERVVCYLQGKNPQRIACFPLILNHAARILGVPVGEYNRDPEKMGNAHIAAFRRYGHDLILVFSTTSTLAEAMGTRMAFFEDDAPQIDVPLIQDLDDIKKVRRPDFTRDGRLPCYLEATEIVVDAIGKETCVSTVLAGPLTTAAALRPIDLFVRDLYKNREWVHELMEICTQAGIQFIDEILKRNSLPIIVEPIGTGSLISPRHFKEFVTPYLKRMTDHIHANGNGMPAVLHICGNSRPNWGPMLESGWNIWSIDSPVDIGAARETAGSQVCLVGNVSTTNLLKSTPGQIDDEARQVCAKAMGSPCGFILGSGCEIPLNTPPENIDALINAARTYGRFDQ